MTELPVQSAVVDSVGCYGLAISGLDDAAALMSPAPTDLPRMTIHRVAATTPPPPSSLTNERAVLALSDHVGHARMDRDLTVTIAADLSYADEALLHPFLSGTFAVANWWLGRAPFHAGAFVVNGRAWAVTGSKGKGKSTLLGYLATQHVPVITDDLVIVENGTVHPGPHFIDLRPDAADTLGVGRDMGVLGARHRARLNVPGVPAPLPLAGWLVLDWADSVELRPVPVEQRLSLLFRNRAVWREPLHPAEFLHLGALPMYELVRPKDWTRLAQVHDALSQLTGGTAP